MVSPHWAARQDGAGGTEGEMHPEVVRHQRDEATLSDLPSCHLFGCTHPEAARHRVPVPDGRRHGRAQPAAPRPCSAFRAAQCDATEKCYSTRSDGSARGRCPVTMSHRRLRTGRRLRCGRRRCSGTADRPRVAGRDTSRCGRSRLMTGGIHCQYKRPSPSPMSILEGLPEWGRGGCSGCSRTTVPASAWSRRGPPR